MRYRLGRSHLDLVYRQLGDAPSDEDVRVAVFSEVSVAIAVVQLLNGEVEESAPLESPAAAALRWYAMHDHGGGMRHQHFPANAGHGSHDGVRLELHRPAAADEPASDRCPSCESPEPCLHPATQAEGEVSRICPDPFHRAPADEPAPVPPSVDALSKLVAQYGNHRADEAEGVDDAGFFASGTFRQIETGIEGLWAAGVEEGRRQYAAERMTLPYEREIYNAGVADGRRQATEERTEEVERFQLLLDHAEQYARDLQDNGDVPERTKEKSICTHCGGKIWLDGSGRWRHRDGMQECDNGPGDVARPVDHG